MSIPFANIPQNWRVPLFYVELDGSQANWSTGGNRVLLIGQELAAGPATVDSPSGLLERFAQNQAEGRHTTEKQS